MNEIDHDKLSLLESEFEALGDGVKLAGFVWLLQNIVIKDRSDRFELVDGLVKLFTDIDINGDGKLEWSEFNQYIIDQVISDNQLNLIFEIGSVASHKISRRPRRTSRTWRSS